MKPTPFLRQFLAIAGSAALAAPLANATTITWDPAGGGASDGAGAWLTAGVWWDGAANVNWTSGDDAIFGNGGAGDAVTLASPTTVNSLTFNNFTGTYTLGTAGQTITLNNGITMNSGAGAATIISPITLGAAQSWTNNDDNLLTIGTGAVINGGYLLTIGGTGDTAVSSIIGGAGGLTKSGSGILTLSGANTFTGQLTVANGTLSISSINNVSVNGTLGNSDLNLPVILGSSGNTGTLKYTAVSGSSEKSFTLAAGGTGAFDITTALTLSGTINGSGNFTKTGAGTLTFGQTYTNTGIGQASQFTGVTTINGGVIKLTVASIGNNALAGSALGLQKSVYDTSGSSGSLDVTATGITTLWLGGLQGSVDFTTALNGEIAIAHLNLNPQTGTTATYGAVIANGAANMILNKLGPGTQTLTGINTYSGATNIYAGTLALSGASGSALNSAFNVRGGTLELDNSGGTWTNRISDSAVLSLGSLTLKSYNGAAIQSETVGATTFAVGGKVTINNGSTLGDQTTLVMGAVTRSVGAAVDFVGTGGTLGAGANSPNVTAASGLTNTNGILGWATVNGNQWAENNAGSIRAYSGTFVIPTTDPTDATKNSQLSGSGTLAAAKSFNSLNLIASGSGESFNLNSGANLTLNTLGGILKSGADAYTISSGGGNITAGASLIAHVDGGALTISAPLNAAILGVAKGGTGNLILSGTRAATFSGAVGIAGGDIEFQGLSTTISGLITGAGGIVANLNAGQTLTIGNASNTFSGRVLVKGGIFSGGTGYNSQGLSSAPGTGNYGPGTTGNPNSTAGGMNNIEINGGLASFPYYFSRYLGAGPDQIQITGGVSGFTGAQAANAFQLGGSTNYEVVWGSDYFKPTTLVLQDATNVGGLFVFNNKLDLNGSTRTVAVNSILVANGAVISGNIRNSSGTAGLTKTGVGTLSLSGTNTYNGGTNINAGTLSFAKIVSMPSTGAVVVTDATMGVALGGAGEWTGTGSGVGTLNGLLAGLGGTGSSTVSYSGNVGLNLNVTTGTVTPGTLSDTTPTGATTLAITKSGGGTLTLSNNNSYSGGTTLVAGTLIADNANALGSSGDISFLGGTLQYTANSAANDYGSRIKNSTSAMLLNTNGQNVSLSGIANTNTGGLTKSGTGTLTLSGTNSFSGTTTLNAGAITLNNGSVSGSAVTFGASNTTMTIQGGSGVTSTWNAGNGDIGTANVGGGISNIQVVIDGAGYAGSAVVTNVKILNWGKSAINSTLLLTDGGQMNVNGEIRIGNPFYSEAGGANLTIGGGTATSTFTGNTGQDFYIGYGERAGSKNNVVTVSAGGVLTSIRDMVVGRAANATSTSNANTMTVSGTGSSWNAGNQTVYVGHTANATAQSNNNILTVGAGASLTNVNNLTVGFGTGTETGNQLVVNGSLSVTTLTVSTGNTLSGSGTINGAITVNGTLSPGNSPGQMTVADSLTLAAASNTVMELGGPTLGLSYDNLTLDALATALTYGGDLNVVNFGLLN